MFSDLSSSSVKILDFFNESGTDWRNLIVNNTNENLLSRLFKEYASQYDRSEECPTKNHKEIERFRIKLFRQLTRNLYMETAIKSDCKGLAEICHWMYFLIGENISFLFDDIHRMFSLGYDNYWKTALNTYQFIFHAFPEKRARANEFLKKNPDGNILELFHERLDNPLFAYRIVYQLHCFEASELRLKKKISFEKAFQTVRKKSFTVLLSQSSNFNKRIYYFTLLKKHQDLIKEINQNPIFKNSEIKDPLNTAEILADTNKLATENTIKILDYIKTITLASLFPAFQAERRMPVQSTVTTTPFKHGKAREDIWKEILNNHLKTSLAYYHRKLLLPVMITGITLDYRDNPNKLADVLYDLKKLAKWILYCSPSFKLLKIELYRLAPPINFLSRKEFELNKKPLIKDAFNLLFSKKLSPQILQAIISDCNMECVRLFRNISVEEVCPQYTKYMEPIKKNLEENIEKKKRTGSKFRESPELSAFLCECDSKTQELSPPCATEDARKKMIDFFNFFSDLFVHKILLAKNRKQATEILKVILTLGVRWTLKPCPNLHLAYVVSSIVSRQEIARLTSIFEGLDAENRATIAKLEYLFKHQKNYKNYRNYIRDLELCPIPFLGFIQSDFLFATQIEKTAQQQAVINEIAEMFLKTQLTIKVTYPFEPFSSDIVQTIYSQRDKLDFPMPKLKISDINGDEIKEDDWNGLSFEEKAYCFSRHRWSK